MFESPCGPIPELEMPGNSVAASGSRGWLGLMGSVSVLQSALMEAAVALATFETAIRELEESRQEDRRPDMQWVSARAMELSSDGFPGQQETESALKEYRHSKWQSGELPRAYLSASWSLAAKGFVFAIFGIRQTFKQLEDRGYTDSRPRDTLENSIGDLQGVRDSIAHTEERAFGEAHRRDITEIHGTNTGMGLCNLKGDRIQYTTRARTTGSVAINKDTLELAVECVQLAINQLSWEGFKEYWPR